MTRPSRDFPVYKRPKAAVRKSAKGEQVAAVSLMQDARPCAYCGTARAVNYDHVVPKSFARIRPIPEELAALEPACSNCNLRKANRRLVPPSWEDKLPALEEAFPGTPWRVWRGDPMEAAYREVWI